MEEQIKTKREKTLEIILIVLTIVLVIGFAYFASELKNCKTCDSVVDLSLIKDAKVKNLANSKDEPTFGELLEADKYSIIYIARPTCGACQVQTPIIEEIVAKDKINIYYLNTDNLVKEQFLQLYKIDTDLFGINGDKFGTPTILIVKKGVIVDSVVGVTEKDDLLQMFSIYK